MPQTTRHSWKVLPVSFAVPLIIPEQLAVDVATALLLFLILGRRLAIVDRVVVFPEDVGALPGLIAKAIPGMGIPPVWILVVVSIILTTTS